MVSDPKKESPTIIGADAQFKGELSFQGSVRVDGKFEGSITTPGKVYVSQGGKMKAEIKAGGVTLDGNVDGNIEASDRLELNTSGRLIGDVKADKLIVKEGATLVGRVEVGSAAGSEGGESSTAAAMRQVSAAGRGRK